jgi:hypothetical protein
MQMESLRVLEARLYFDARNANPPSTPSTPGSFTFFGAYHELQLTNRLPYLHGNDRVIAGSRISQGMQLGGRPWPDRRGSCGQHRPATRQREREGRRGRSDAYDPQTNLTF